MQARGDTHIFCRPVGTHTFLEEYVYPTAKGCVPANSFGKAINTLALVASKVSVSSTCGCPHGSSPRFTNPQPRLFY